MIRRVLGYTVRKLWLILAILLVLAAVALSVVRYSLPYLDHYRTDIEAFIEEQYGQRVSIGSMSADWTASGPSLVLLDIDLQLEENDPFQLSVERTHLVLNFWQSLWERQFLLDNFILDGVQLDVVADLPQEATQDHPIVEAIEGLLLHQLERFRAINSEIRLLSQQGVARSIFIEELSWVNHGTQRQALGRFAVADVTANNLDFVLDVQGNSLNDMQGELYVEAQRLDVSPWLEQVVAGVDFTRAEFNVTGWLDFNQGRIGAGQVHFGENRLQWRRDKDLHELTTSPVTWALWPGEDGWLLNSESLIVTIDDKPWPVESIIWEYQNQHHHWAIRNLELRDIGPLWGLMGAPVEQVQSWFAGVQPTGIINDIQVSLDAQREWLFYAQADNLNWQPYRGVPGIRGLDVSVWSSTDAGSFAVQGDNVSLYSPSTYSEEQDLSRIRWDGYWFSLKDGWAITVPEARLSLPHVDLKQHLLVSQRGSSSPELEWFIHGAGKELDVNQALELLPLQLGDGLTEYLAKSVQAGEVNETTMLWRGDLENFPYQRHEGVFQASLEADALDFRFQPDWLPMRDTHLNLEFRDRGLKIQTRGGTLGDVRVEQVEALIPDLFISQRWLHVDAVASGSGVEAQQVFAQSPLADTVGAALSEIRIEDSVTGSATLRIPLFPAASDTDELRLSASGNVRFDGQTVTIDPIQQEFQHMKGLFRFDNTAITLHDASAEVRGIPIRLTLNGDSTEHGYRLDAELDGAWRASELIESLDEPVLSNSLSGVLSADARFSLNFADGGYAFDWSMQTDMTELGIDLAAPLTKSAGEPAFWQTRIQGDENLLSIKSEWPGTLAVEGELETGSRIPEWLSLALGARALERSEDAARRGLSVFVELDETSLNQWVPLINLLRRGTEPSGYSATFELPPLKQLHARIDSLHWLGQSHDNVEVVTSERENDWRFTLNAEQGRATITLPNDPMQRIDIEADFLELTKVELGESPAGGSLIEQDIFDRLPPLRFVCHICHYEGSQLGRVLIELAPALDGEQLQAFNISRTGGELNVTGGWQRIEDQFQTNLQGWFASTDIGRLLHDFNANSVVRDSNAQAEFDLSWQGTPNAFNVETLSGRVDWRLGSGYLRDVSDGGARLFSLFSLEGLLRKLTLDFRDIFARGMFYSSFRGSFEVEQGVVYTNDTRMDGSAGDMEVTGHTDLRDDSLDYNLVYVPKVTSSLPVLLAWMVNPPSGIAALLIDRVLHDAQVISRLEYHIGGSVSEPVVTEVARDARDVELPAIELESELEEELNDDTN